MSEFKIPAGWSEVSIGSFQELSEVSTTGIQGAVDRLAILCDCDPEELRQLPVDKLGAMAEKVQWAQQLPTEQGYKRRFRLDGRDFAMINLDRVTLGEWVDLEQLINDGAQKNLHRVLAILFREVYADEPSIDLVAVKKYDTDEAARNAKVFQSELDVETVYGACLFFSLFGSQLALSTVSSLRAEVMTMSGTITPERPQPSEERGSGRTRG